MKKYIVAFCVLLGLIFILKRVFEIRNDKEDGYFKSLESSFNLLQIKQTQFKYKGLSVYSLGKPDYKFYNNYPINQFFFISEGIVEMLTIDKNCYPEYVANGVNPIKSLSSIHDLNPCTIIIRPFIDLKSNFGDTIYLYDNSVKLSNYWCTLKWKEYSSSIKDTIYIFKRRLGNVKQEWLYYVSKQKGIVGMAKMDWGKITDSIGYPFVGHSDKRIKLDTPNVNILHYVKDIKHD